MNKTLLWVNTAALLLTACLAAAAGAPGLDGGAIYGDPSGARCK